MNPVFSFSLQKTTHIRFEIIDHEKLKKNSTVSMIINEIERMRTWFVPIQ